VRPAAAKRHVSILGVAVIFKKTSVMVLFSVGVLLSGGAGLRAATLSQEVLSGEGLPIGVLVSIQSDNADQVELSHTDNGQYLFGVTVGGMGCKRLGVLKKF
jgi:hypothetical protein